MPTRGVDPERPTCAGCRARAVPAREVLCGNCWPQVPRPIQRAVRQAQKAWNTDPDDFAWALLLYARGRALDSLPWNATDRPECQDYDEDCQTF